MTDASRAALRRVVDVPGAVLLGLGSILGTGIFVAVGTAAGIAGEDVVVAAVLAGGVATASGLSSARLAAAYPVSGGTYEYAHRLLTPALGFAAGWTFLCAKSASAASAALGLAGYLVAISGSSVSPVPIAIAAIAGITILVAGGLTRTSRANAVIVSVTVGALSALVVAGLPTLVASKVGEAGRPHARDLGALLHAAALLFVAYTGYARIATLGEEVRDPGRSIPRAIVVTLAVTILLVASVAAVAVAVLGPERLAAETARTAAPLEAVARELAVPGLPSLVAVGAVTAMLGVAVNLVLGNSRVILAMARRGDLPAVLAEVGEGSSPRKAVGVAGAVIAGLTAIGNVATTWSFSAFTVLLYYAITNLAALRLPAVRPWSRPLAVAGLASCLGLAFWVEPRVWLVGILVIAAGFVLRALLRGLP